MRVVIVGGGPAGRSALAALPQAVLVTRPAVAWHAEPGRVWVEEAGTVRSEAFDALILCADEPLLLSALGCVFEGVRPGVDGAGRTSVPGVFAAGLVCGATRGETAAAQGRAAAEAVGSAAWPALDGAAQAAPERLDPVALASLLEQPLGPGRNEAVLAQAALLGPVLPARPVSLAALAALTPERPVPRPVQPDEGAL